MYKAIEGFFVESVEGLIFDVKGLVHPPDKIVAYVRYVPSKEGDRVRDGKRYRKIYSLSERMAFLEANYPQYIYDDPVFNIRIQCVPIDRISKIYDPCEYLSRLMNEAKSEVEKQVVEFVSLIIAHSGINLDNIGVTGSLLVGLAREDSDIDLVVYGKDACLRVYRVLRDLFKDERLSRYDLDSLYKLYEFRVKDTQISFRNFVVTESRKLLQGLFRERDFYIRLVKRPEEFGERYGDRVYEPLGFQEVSAMVVDDSDSIFTPCRYVVDDVRILSGVKEYTISEIFSFRGRFCEIARRGERVRARGKLERVKASDGSVYYRLILGGSREDYMMLEKWM